MFEFHSIGLAFLEGIGLILSPCILPILPLVLAAGVEGGRKRPFGIIIGFILAFSLFTLASRQLIIWTHVDPEWIQQISYVLLLLFGVILFSEKLSDKFGAFTGRFADLGGRFSGREVSGFFGGIVLGAMIGFVWVPCAGPLLAAVVVQTVTQTTTIQSFLILAAFSLGAGIPMFFITLFGRELLSKLGFLQKHIKIIRKMLGLILIVTVLVTSGWLSKIKFAAMAETPVTIASTPNAMHLMDGIANPYQAPEITGIEAWLNSPDLSLKSLKGKVVLVDFWTYSCINCIRTLPSLGELYKKYHDKGLEIIGVHSPEFEFEKKLPNVTEAIKKHNIKYPIALDNQFKTWLAFHNQYWPAHYLIDQNGRVVYTHFGEGGEDALENNIRYLLNINEGAKTSVVEKKLPQQKELTSETYLGYKRMMNFQSPEKVSLDMPATYTYPGQLDLDHWALKGDWDFKHEHIVAKSKGSSLKLNFFAQKVFLVMGTESDKPIKVQIKLKGEPIAKNSGHDVKNNEIQITKNTLYELVKLPSTSKSEVEIIAEEPGLQLYAFTFG